MHLVRLVYASRFSKTMNLEELRNILEVSREENPKKCITGVLCYGPGLFLQCLEGPRPEVNELYCKIANDTRNEDVSLLDYGDINERAFEQWSMAYVKADDITEHLIMRFSAGKSFDPFSMTGEQALGFVHALLEEKERFLHEVAG